MKAFRFPLQAILTLREEKEEEAQRLVANALHAVAQVEAGLARVSQELTRLGEDFRVRVGQGMPARELAELGGYRTVLTERQAQLQRDREAAEEKVREARAELVRRTQDRQVLDTYRDKLHRAWERDQARLEQKLLDDLAGRAPATGGGRALGSPATTPRT